MPPDDEPGALPDDAGAWVPYRDPAVGPPEGYAATVLPQAAARAAAERALLERGEAPCAVDPTIPNASYYTQVPPYVFPHLSFSLSLSLSLCMHSYVPT